MKAIAGLFIGLVMYVLIIRGVVSFFVPTGMDCYGGWRPCPFGPGVVGSQECRAGRWSECRPERCTERLECE